MADVSKIKLTDNTEYDIKDAIARQSIATTDEKTDEIIEQLNNPTYTTTEGTDLSIDNTRVGKMKFEYYGDTEQEIIGNLNRFNYTLSILKTRNASGTWSNNVYTNNSVTFTINEDLTITVNGTANANTYFYLNASNDSYFKTLNGLTLKLTGTPTGGGNDTYQMTITSADWSNGTNDNGNGGQFTAIEDFYNNTYIRIANGYNCSNLTFKPMLSTTLTTSYNDYEQPTAGNGSPSPSYPKEVKTVTGDNTIDIVGKNLFNANNGSVGYIKNDGTIGSATDNFSSDFIYLGENQDFTISANTTMNNIGIAYFDENKNIILPRVDNNNKQTVTKNMGNATYVRFWVQKSGVTMSASVVSETYQVMLEKGSTASTYEPYQGQSYEINLGKNLFKPFSFVSRLANGLTSMRNDDNSITMIGTTTALTNHWLNDLNMRLLKGTYTFSTSCDLTGKMTFVLKDSGGNNVISFNSGKTYTFTLASETIITQALIQVAGSVTLHDTFTMQLEKRKCCYNIRAIFRTNSIMRY